MIGLGLAALYVLFSLVTKGEPLTTYKKAANFLFYWYVSVSLMVMVLGSIATVVTGASFGVLFGGVLGGIFGVVVGSAAAFGLLLAVTLAYILEIIGAYLLRESLTINKSDHDWHPVKFGIGAACLMVGLLAIPKIS